jgi:hypothetical protein
MGISAVRKPTGRDEFMLATRYIPELAGADPGSAGGRPPRLAPPTADSALLAAIPGATAARMPEHPVEIEVWRATADTIRLIVTYSTYDKFPVVLRNSDELWPYYQDLRDGLGSARDDLFGWRPDIGYEVTLPFGEGAAQIFADQLHLIILSRLRNGITQPAVERGLAETNLEVAPEVLSQALARTRERVRDRVREVTALADAGNALVAVIDADGRAFRMPLTAKPGITSPSLALTLARPDTHRLRLPAELAPDAMVEAIADSVADVLAYRDLVFAATEVPSPELEPQRALLAAAETSRRLLESTVDAYLPEESAEPAVWFGLTVDQFIELTERTGIPAEPSPGDLLRLRRVAEDLVVGRGLLDGAQRRDFVQRHPELVRDAFLLRPRELDPLALVPGTIVDFVPTALARIRQRTGADRAWLARTARLLLERYFYGVPAGARVEAEALPAGAVERIQAAVHAFGPAVAAWLVGQLPGAAITDGFADRDAAELAPEAMPHTIPAQPDYVPTPDFAANADETVESAAAAAEMFRVDRQAMRQLTELTQLAVALRQGLAALPGATAQAKTAELVEPIIGLFEAIGPRAAELAEQVAELADRHAIPVSQGFTRLQSTLAGGYERLADALGDVVARWEDLREYLEQAGELTAFAAVWAKAARDGRNAELSGGVFELAGAQISAAEAAEHAEAAKRPAEAVLTRIEQLHEPFDEAVAGLLAEAKSMAATHAGSPVLAVAGELVDPAKDRPRFLRANPRPGARPGLDEVSERDLEVIGRLLDLLDQHATLLQALDAGGHRRRAADFAHLRADLGADRRQRENASELFIVETELKRLVGESMHEGLNGGEVRFKWLEEVALAHPRFRGRLTTLNGLRLAGELRKAAESLEPALVHALWLLDNEEFGDPSVTGVFDDQIYHVATEQTTEFPIESLNFGIGGRKRPPLVESAERSFHNVVTIDWWSGSAKANGGRIFRPGFSVQFRVSNDDGGPAVRRAEWAGGKELPGGWVEGTQIILELRRNATRDEVRAALKPLLLDEIAKYRSSLPPLRIDRRAMVLIEAGAAGGLTLGGLITLGLGLELSSVFLAGRAVGYAWSMIWSWSMNYISSGKQIKAGNDVARLRSVARGGRGPAVPDLTQGVHDEVEKLTPMAEVTHTTLPDAPAYEETVVLDDGQIADFATQAERLGRRIVELLVDKGTFPRHYIPSSNLAKTVDAIVEARWEPPGGAAVDAAGEVVHDFGSLIIKLGTGEKIGNGETLKLALTLGEQSHSYQYLKGGDADTAELRYWLGLAPNLYDGGGAAMMDALAEQVVDTVKKGSTLWIQPSMKDYLRQRFTMWPVDAVMATVFAISAGRQGQIAPLVLASGGTRAGYLAASYLNFKHRTLAKMIKADAVRERQNFGMLTGTTAFLDMADRSLGVVRAAVEITGVLDAEIQRGVATERPDRELVPSEQADLLRLAAEQVRDQALREHDVRAVEIVESGDELVVVISAELRLRQPRLPGELRITMGTNWELPGVFSPMTTHGLVHTDGLTDVREFSMLVPGQWTQGETRLRVDEMARWMGEHTGDVIARSRTLHRRETRQLGAASFGRAVGSGAVGAVVSMAQGNQDAVGQEVLNVAKATGDGVMTMVTARADIERQSEKAMQGLNPRASTARAMDDWVWHGLRSLNRLENGLLDRLAEAMDKATDPAEREQLRALLAELGERPAAPGQLIDAFEHMLRTGELVDRIPHLAMVTRLGRGEYLLYVDKVPSAGPNEIWAKLKGAHRQHLTLRLLPEIPGKPTIVMRSGVDADFIAFGHDIDSFVEQLSGEVADYHNGSTGVPDRATYLVEEVGDGNVGGLISRGTTGVLGPDPSGTDLAIQAGAAVFSTAVNTTSASWFRRGDFLKRELTARRFYYDSTAMSDDRDLLAQFIGGAINEHNRKLAGVYLTFAEITGRYAPVTVEIMRTVVEAQDSSQPIGRLLVARGLNPDELPDRWTWTDLDDLVRRSGDGGPAGTSPPEPPPVSPGVPRSLLPPTTDRLDLDEPPDPPWGS